MSPFRILCTYRPTCRPYYNSLCLNIASNAE